MSDAEPPLPLAGLDGRLTGAERAAIPLLHLRIVEAVLFHKDAKKLAEISRNLGEPMVGINVGSLDEKELLATRGW